MGPEELQAILQAAQRAQQRGASPAEVNTLIQKHTGLRNMPALITVAQGGTPTPEQQAPPSMQEKALKRANKHSPVSNFARSLAQGLSFETADEIAGGAAALGAMVPGGRSPGEAFQEVAEGSRQRMEDLETAAPSATGAARLGGGLLAGALPVGKAMQVGSKAKGILGGLRAGKSAKRAAQGAQEASKIRAATAGTFRPGAESARGIGRAARKGATVGAAEGGLLGLGAGEGVEGKAKSAAQLGAGGALLGAGIGGFLKTLTAVPGTIRSRGILQRARNPRIASEAEDVVQRKSGTKPSQVLDEMQERRKVVQAKFKELEGTRATNHQLRTVLNQPIIRAQDLGERLRKMGRENVYDRALTDNRPLQFEDVQDIRAALQDKIDSAFRGGENQLGFRLAEQKRNMDDAIGSMFDEADARRAWRELSMVPDALDQGQKAAKMAPDELRLTLRQFGGHPEAQLAFRVGLVRNMLDDIGKKSGNKAVRPSADMISKLELAAGPEAAQEIVGVMREEGIREAREKTVDLLVKAGGFVFGGTSLLGGAAITGLGG